MKRTFLLIPMLAFLVSCKGPQGPAGPPGSGGIETLTDPAILPKVIYTYPPANTVGPYEDFDYPRITIRFNKIMQLSEVRKAIALSSPFDDLRADSALIYTFGGDIFSVYPVDTLGNLYQRWRIGQTYTLDISSRAKDINGHSLVPPFTMDFMPEPQFRVRNVNPRNGALNVWTYASIDLYFNSALDSSILSTVQLSPSVNGQWYLSYSYPYPELSSIHFLYSQGSVLENNTTYTLTVSQSARDKYGNQLPQQFISSFTTKTFALQYTFPEDGNTDVNLNTYISAYFTGPIDTGSVRSAVTINPPPGGNFALYDGSSGFSFIPTNGLAGNTTYGVTISTALRSKGGTNLPSPYSFSFTTAPFRVTNSTPYAGQTGVSRNTSIHVGFNGILDTASVRTGFTISPAVSGSFQLYDPASYFYFSPSAALAANQTYTVTIAATVRCKSGSVLGSPYVFSFTTGN